MARLPIPGGDDGKWGEILNNYLSIEHNSDGTQKTLPLRKGGTGATNLTDARANLGIGGMDVYIQHEKPKASGSYFWIQTGLGPKGSDISFWVEDGTGR